MTARNLTLIISSFIAFWVFTLFFIEKLIPNEVIGEYILIFTFLSFGLFYLIISYFVNLFIKQKTTPFYKLVKSKGIRLRKLKVKMNNIDSSQKITNDIESWSNEKLQQIKELRNMEQYRRAFLGDVSHELRTPIFTIQGYIETLLDGGLEDPSINRKYLERTDKSIERMISIVEDLISISKLESGEIEIHKSAFSIQELVLDIVEMQEVRAKKKGVELIFNNNSIEDFIVYADKKLIYQVVLNLIVNAIAYGKENGKVILSILHKDKNIFVQVTDQGDGIAKEHLDRIFNRFYRIDKSRSREYGGTGLGLAICKHIMEAHQQEIFVKSELGKGSIFSFSLKILRNNLI